MVPAQPGLFGNVSSNPSGSALPAPGTWGHLDTRPAPLRHSQLGPPPTRGCRWMMLRPALPTPGCPGILQGSALPAPGTRRHLNTQPMPLWHYWLGSLSHPGMLRGDAGTTLKSCWGCTLPRRHPGNGICGDTLGMGSLPQRWAQGCAEGWGGTGKGGEGREGKGKGGRGREGEAPTAQHGRARALAKSRQLCSRCRLPFFH